MEQDGKALLEARTGRSVATNVDFYSGLLYRMLGLPQELFTPLFAIARMVGWSAHRMEEMGQGGKIIRPATKCVEKRRAYVPMAEDKPGIYPSRPALEARTGHFFPSILRKKRLSAQRGIDNRGGRGYHGSTWHRNKK